MKKTFVKALLILFLFLNVSSIASAQDVSYITQPPTFELAEPMSPSSESIPSGASITPVRVGDRARLDGVLYSLEANAWLISEINRLQVVWISEMNTRVSLTFAWAEHELESQALRSQASIDMMQLRLDSRNRDVEAITEINQELVRASRRQVRRNRFKLVLTVVGVGALAGMGGYFIGQATGR